MLPKYISHISVPPIKCQGIKTKLVSFIAENINWDGKGTWVEPFLGSGVVAFNLQPQSAILADTNEHIINLYNQIQSHNITPQSVREFLFKAGKELEQGSDDFYYHVRKRFNLYKDPYDFLFLNRSCFNGLMRFNRKGEFNVPFGKKPQRFSKSYITKIVNQVRNAQKIMTGKDWVFVSQNWEKTLKMVKKNDFVYLDPPYIGRHTDYYNNWDTEEAIKLSRSSQKLKSKFALSMWLENKYRSNDHINEFWNTTNIITKEHFYHVGSKEVLRNAITEALILK